MRVLVTRPEEDARSLVAALEARGHEALVEPMLTIAPAEAVAAPLDLAGVQALLFTSANGVRVFAQLTEIRDLPVFTVGDTSAEVARAAGFTAVVSAGGDVDDLARLAIARLDPAAGALYQAAASRLAGDLKDALEGAGFTLRREVLYEATPASDLTGTLRLELATGAIEVATFFSPRTAETFVALAGNLGLGDGCADVTALCLSAAVAEKLRVLEWRALLIAERPNQAALLTRLDELAGPAPESEPANPKPSEDHDLNPAQKIIAGFGGIRPMAGKVGVAVSTVQGWRERGAIPARHHARVLKAAEAAGIEIAAADLGHSTPKATAAPKAKVGASAASHTPRRQASKPPSEPGPKPEPKSEPEPKPAPKLKPPEDAEPVFGRGWLSGALPGALLGALLLAAGAGGAFLARDLWMPLADSEYGALDGGELMSFERRIAALESAGAQDPLGLGPEALAPLDEALQTLQARVDAFADGASDDDAATAARLTALTGRLDALDGRLDDIAVQAQDQTALIELTERLGDIAARVEDVAARPDLAPEIASLSGRVDELAAAGVATEVAETGDAALSFAVLQLREALRGSGAFVAELNLLRDLAASGALAEGAQLNEMIAPLAAHAEAGIPNLAGLKAEFPARLRGATIAARGGAGDDWWAGVVRRLSNLASLRPVGAAEGAGAGAVLARAEARLRADDLAAALDELAALEGPAAEAVRTWREAAAARLAARRALTGLGQLLLARLQAGGG